MHELVEVIKRARSMVAFTGAGMDTESRLPDFRGPKGLWKNHDPRALASTEALANHYPLFHEFYSHRLQVLEGVQPHKGHEILAKWERQGRLKTIITQNVSGLQSLAGSKNVIELHGNLRHIYCQSCHQASNQTDFLTNTRCSCGGKLRPGVILFGEALPQEAFHQADEALSRADLILILGTSLEVYPAAQLPFIYPMTRVYVDLEANEDPRIDFIYRESIGDFLEQLDQLIDQK